MNWRHILQGVAAAAVIVAILFYQGNGARRQNTSPLPAAAKKLPQYYTVNSRTWTYEKSGALAEVVESNTTEYYLDSDQTVLEQPRYFSHNGSDKTWAASARTGQFFHHSGKLILDDDVLLHNDASGADLRTSAVEVDTVNKVARSQAAVAVTQANNQITAQGMVADFKVQQLQLTGNVNSTYVPPQP